MTTHPTNWRQALACVTGALVHGEQRITTHELLTVHLGVPVTDQNRRRLRRVMHDLGWRGPRRMRWGQREAIGTLLDQLKLNGYKIVHMTANAPVQTLPAYDEQLLKDQKLPTVSQRPTSDVV